MILYINKNNEIKDVNITTDDTLIPFEIGENDYNPFANWSVAKICCHAIKIKDNRYDGFYPYVDIRIIEHIDRLSTQNMSAQAQIDYIAMMTDVEI